MPASRTALVALESAAELSGHSVGKRETQRTVQAVSRTGQEPAAGNSRGGSSGVREGNHFDVFSTTAATGLAAMKGSSRNGDLPASVSVRGRAGAPWNGSGNGNGAGAARCDSSGNAEPRCPRISRTY